MLYNVVLLSAVQQGESDVYVYVCIYTPSFLDFLPIWVSLVAQTVKCLPAVRETRVQSLGWQDPLEKEMAPHSSTLAWKIPWTEEPGRLQSTGSQIQTRLSDFTFTFFH